MARVSGTNAREPDVKDAQAFPLHALTLRYFGGSMDRALTYRARSRSITTRRSPRAKALPGPSPFDATTPQHSRTAGSWRYIASCITFPASRSNSILRSLLGTLRA